MCALMKSHFEKRNLDMTSDAHFYLPVETAIAELRRRRQNTRLVNSTTNFLGGDIPSYLVDHECFVLPRHIATPNFETLYVLEQAERHGTLAVLSQDLDDTFTSVNDLKRRLARPEILLNEGPSRLYRKIDLVDIPKAEGRQLKHVCTRSGQSLTQFHNSLFLYTARTKYYIVNDASWIDRNGRRNLSLHYIRFLALFVTHGVLFDYFHSEEDALLNKRFFAPAFLKIRSFFGCSPIIVKPFQKIDARFDLAHDRFFNKFFDTHRHESTTVFHESKD